MIFSYFCPLSSVVCHLICGLVAKQKLLPLKKGTVWIEIVRRSTGAVYRDEGGLRGS